MLKYYNTQICLQEVPNEISLGINITNCPVHCPGCHSQYLWKNIGNALDGFSLNKIIKEEGDGITCILFLGGDSDPISLNKLASYIRKDYPNLKIAWYSGKQDISKDINLNNFDCIKVGPYIEEKGGLDKKTTNQKMYKIVKGKIEKDITDFFYENHKINPNI